MSDIRLFSSDLDGTLLGDGQATARFVDAWNALSPGVRPLLVYNTGRTVADTLDLVRSNTLPEPDYIVGSIGTELHDSMYQHGHEFRSQFGAGWDRELVDSIVGSFAGVERQPAKFLHRYKSSWYWSRAPRAEIALLQRRLADAQIRATVVYSCGRFLDVMPACAGKGKAIAWLCERLGIPMSRVLVAGDTGNDADMFVQPGVNGLLVENAIPELLSVATGPNVFRARKPMADGVIEGLTVFGVIPTRANDEPRTPPSARRRTRAEPRA